MLEGLMTGLINKYLGPYVENLDNSNLKIGLFNGKVSLNNVIIKPDSLNALLEAVPLRIVSGTIGSINIDIPLTALRTKPVVVQADEIYLLLSPSFAGKSPVHALVAAHKAKLALLKSLERHFVLLQSATARAALGGSSLVGGSADDAAIMEGLLATAVANLQVRITRVHVRYEHPLRTVRTRGPGGACAPMTWEKAMVMGVTLAELSVLTTNDKWVEEFLRGDRGKLDTVYKALRLQGLSIYSDTDVQAAPFTAIPAALGTLGAGVGAAGQARTSASVRLRALDPILPVTAGGGRSLAWMGHVFETQVTSGQVSVVFPPSNLGEDSAQAQSKRGGGAGAGMDGSDSVDRDVISSQSSRVASSSSRRREEEDDELLTSPSSSASVTRARRRVGAGASPGTPDRGQRDSSAPLPSTFAAAYAYVLVPARLSVRAAIGLGFAHSKPKVSLWLETGELALHVSDRQFALVLGVGLEHTRAWESRQLGLPFVSAAAAHADAEARMAAATVAAAASAAMQQGIEAGGMRASTRRLRAGSAFDRDAPIGSGGATAGSPTVTFTLAARHAKRLQLLRAVVARYRASIRERERHAFIAAVTGEYTRLYIRRLKAAELLSLPALNVGERRRLDGIERDPRIAYMDVLALRRAAERWVREQLRLPLGDVSRRRDDEVRHWENVFLAEAQEMTAAGGKGGAGAPGSSSVRKSARSVAPGGKSADTDVSKSFFGRMFGVKSVSVDGPLTPAAQQVSAVRTGAGSSSSAAQKHSDSSTSVTLAEMEALYAQLGYEYDPSTGAVHAKPGSETAAADAASVANHGLPRSYVWLRLHLDVRRISLLLERHVLAGSGLSEGVGTSVARGAGMGVSSARAVVPSLTRQPSSLLTGLASGAIGIPGTFAGSLAACGSYVPVSRLEFSRTVAGFDLRASSWAFSLDLGDLTIVDLGDDSSVGGTHAPPSRALPLHARTGLVGPARLRRRDDNMHRFIVFSDHGREDSESGAGTGVAGIARSGRAVAVGLVTQDDGPVITESAICDERLEGVGVVAGARTAPFSQWGGAAAGISTHNRAHMGGGNLPTNPVRVGLVSIRVVFNPGSAGLAVQVQANAQGGGSAPANASKQVVVAVPRQRSIGLGGPRALNPYVDDSDDDDEGARDSDDGTPSGGGYVIRGRTGKSLEPDSDDSDADVRLHGKQQSDEEEDDDSLRSRVDILGARSRKLKEESRDLRLRAAQRAAGSLSHGDDRSGSASPGVGGSSSVSDDGSVMDQDAVFLRLRIAARPLVLTWSPPFVRRVIAWLWVADNLSSGDATHAAYLIPIDGPAAVDAAPCPEPRRAFCGNLAALITMLDHFTLQALAFASATLEAALVSHKNKVDVRGYIGAPTLVLPQSVSRGEASAVSSAERQQGSDRELEIAGEEEVAPVPMLVLDLGAITFSSRLALAAPSQMPSTGSATATPSPTPMTTSKRGAGTTARKKAQGALLEASLPAILPPAGGSHAATLDPARTAHILLPNLASAFDRYLVTATGLSLLLVQRSHLGEAEEHEPALHGPRGGVGPLAVIEGVAPHLNARDDGEGEGAVRRGVRNVPPVHPPSSMGEDGPSMEIIPRICWRRDSARYLTRGVILRVDLHANTSGRDHVLRPVEDSPSPGTMCLLPLPNLYLSARVDHLRVSTTSGQGMTLAKIGLVAFEPILDVLSASPEESSQGEGVTRMRSAASARAHHTASGIIPRVFPPFDDAPADFFAFSDPRAILRGLDPAALLERRGEAVARLREQASGAFLSPGAGGGALPGMGSSPPSLHWERQQVVARLCVTGLALRIVHGDGGPRRGGGGPRHAHALRDKEGSDKGGGGGMNGSPQSCGGGLKGMKGQPVAAPSPGRFDVLLSADDVDADFVVSDGGVAWTAFLRSLAVYVGAGSATRGLLLQLGVRTCGAFLNGTGTGTPFPPSSHHSVSGSSGSLSPAPASVSTVPSTPSSTSAAAPPLSPSRGLDESGVVLSTGPAPPTSSQRTLLHAYLSRAEASLVRRPDSAFNYVDEAYFQHGGTGGGGHRPPHSGQVGGNGGMRRGSLGSLAAVAFGGKGAAALLSTGGGGGLASLRTLTYASVLAELRADATYLVAPFTADALLDAHVPSPSSSPAMAVTLLVRVGPLTASLVPVEAATVLSLSSCVMEGVLGLVAEVTEDLLAYLEAKAKGEGEVEVPTLPLSSRPASSTTPTRHHAPPLLDIRLVLERVQATLYTTVGGGADLSMQARLPVLRATVAGAALSLHPGTAGSGLGLKVVATTSVSHWHAAGGVWEAFLEPWPCALALQSKGGPRERDADLVQCDVQGSAPLNISVSTALLRSVPTIQSSIQDIVETWTAAAGGGILAPSEHGGAVGIMPFVLVNETGLKVQVWRPGPVASPSAAVGTGPSERPDTALLQSGNVMPLSALFLTVTVDGSSGDGGKKEGAEAGAHATEEGAQGREGHGVSDRVMPPPEGRAGVLGAREDGVDVEDALPAELQVSRLALYRHPAGIRGARPVAQASHALAEGGATPPLSIAGPGPGKTWYASADAEGVLEEADVFQPTDGGGSFTGDVTVSVNLQLAGYEPLLRQPIHCTGSTFVRLQPLSSLPRAVTVGRRWCGVALLDQHGKGVSARRRRREAREVREEESEEEEEEEEEEGEEDDVSDSGGSDEESEEEYKGSPSHAIEGQGTGAAHVTRAVGAALRRVLDKAGREVKRAGVSVAPVPLVLEVSVTAGEGEGIKYIRLRSPLLVTNSTGIPVAVRLLPHSVAPEGGNGVTGQMAEAEARSVSLARAMHDAAVSVTGQRQARARASVERQAGILAHDTAARRSLFRSDASVTHTASVRSNDGAAVARLADEATLTDVFHLAASDALALRLPLDRVLLPGASWRVPALYAGNVQVFLRPALPCAPSALEAGAAVRHVGQGRASEPDDGFVSIWLPGLRGGRGAAGSVHGEDEEGEDLGSPPRHPVTHAPPFVAGDVTLGDYESGEEEEAECDGEEEEDEEEAPMSYVHDPRFTWSSFEGVSGPGPIWGAKAHSQSAFEERMRKASEAVRKTLHMGPASEGEGGGVAGADAAPVGLTSSAGAAVAGLGVTDLARDAILRMVRRAVAAGQGTADAADTGSNDAGERNSNGDGDVAFSFCRKQDVVHLAVCVRNRDAVIAAPADMHAVGAAEALLLSNSFYHVCSTLEMQPIAVFPRATPKDAGKSHGQGSGDVSDLASRVCAFVHVCVRAPMAVQNACACTVMYEVGFPASTAGAGLEGPSSSEAGASASQSASRGVGVSTKDGRGSLDAKDTDKVNEQDKVRGGSLFSRLRRKKEVKEADSLDGKAVMGSPVVSEAGCGMGSIDHMLTVATGSLAPSQSLSLLYAHPDPPPLPTTSKGSTSRSAYKLRLTGSRYARALSVRFRLPEGGFAWSPWVGLWTAHGSALRTALVTPISSVGGASSSQQALPLLVLPFHPGRVQTQPLPMRDETGEAVFLSTEHALVASASTREQSSAPASSSMRQALYGLSLTLFAPYWLVNATALPIVFSTAVKDVGGLGIGSAAERALRGVRPGPGQCVPITVEVWDNERLQMFKFGKKGHLLPTDRPSWSDKWGLVHAETGMESVKLPGVGWTWAGEWAVDTSGEVDEEGWSYNVDFPRGHDTGWVGKRTGMHSVRRRRWIRTRVPPPSSALSKLTAQKLLGMWSGQVSLSPASSHGSKLDVKGGIVTEDGPGAAQPEQVVPLSSVGVYQYGPPPRHEDAVALRISDSTWSQPFPLRAVGRPSVFSVTTRPSSSIIPVTVVEASGKEKGKDKKRKEKEQDGEKVQEEGGGDGQRYELAVCVRPAQSVPGFGSTFHRTLVVTVSPRFIIMNLVDPYLAMLVQHKHLLTGSGESRDPLSDCGVYLLQVAQAGAIDPDTGACKPCAHATAYLGRISLPSTGGADSEYDVGPSLRKQMLWTGLVDPTGGSGEAAGSTAHSAKPVASEVPYAPAAVLTVPPGESVSVHWASAAAASAAGAHVCLRVVRLLEQGGSAQDGISTGASRVRKSVVVPLTEWSGAADIGTVGESVMHLKGAGGYLNREYCSPSAPTVMLRVAVRPNAERGAALVLVTAESGLSTLDDVLVHDPHLQQVGEGVGAAAAKAAAVAAVMHTPSRLTKWGGQSGTVAHGAPPYSPLLWWMRHGEVSLAVWQARLTAYFKGKLTGCGMDGSGSKASLQDILADLRSEAQELAAMPAAAPPPAMYRLDNFTLDTFAVTQKGVTGRSPILVPPRSSVVLAWEEPCLPSDAADRVCASSLAEAKEELVRAVCAGASSTGGKKKSGGARALMSAALMDFGRVMGRQRDVGGDWGSGSGLAFLVRCVTAGPDQVVHLKGQLGGQGSGKPVSLVPRVLELAPDAFATAASLELPVGKTGGEEEGEGPAPAAMYGHPFLLRMWADGRPVGAGPVHPARSPWSVHRGLDGSYGLGEGHTPGKRRGVGVGVSPPLLAREGGCMAAAARIASPLAGVGGGGARAFDLPACPLVLESASQLFQHFGVPAPDAPSGVPGPRAGVSVSAADKVEKVLKRLSSVRALSGTASAGVLVSANSVALATPAGAGISEGAIRYGDIVLLRHDTVVHGAGRGRAASAGSDDDEEGEGEMEASQPLSLYLVAHVDGRSEWLQRDVALAVSTQVGGAPDAPARMRPGAAHGPPACAAFLVVGGQPGSAVLLSRHIPGKGKEHERNSHAESTGAGARGAMRSGGGHASVDSDSEGEGEGEGPADRHMDRYAPTGTGFGLLPVAFIDRLLEGASEPHHGEDGGGGGPPGLVRQCRIPSLSPAGSVSAATVEGANAPRDIFGDTAGGGAEVGAGGSRVMSAMQRRRLAARGVSVGDDVEAATCLTAAVPLPSSRIPSQLKAGAVQLSVGACVTAAQRAGIGGSFDEEEEEGQQEEEEEEEGEGGVPFEEQGHNGARSAGATGSTARPKLYSRAASRADARTGEPSPASKALRSAVLALPMLSVLPPSCVFAVSPLTSMLLPPRVVGGRVGYDAATRVITLTTHAHSQAAGVGAGDKGGTDRKGRGKGVEGATAQASGSLRLSASLSLPLLSLSCVDAVPQELAVLTLEGVSARLGIDRPYVTAELSILDLQIDNQLPLATFPVMVGRSPSKGPVLVAADGSPLLRPFLQASVVLQPPPSRPRGRGQVGLGLERSGPEQGRVRAGPEQGQSAQFSSASQSSSAVLVVPYLSLLIQEVDISVEEAIVRRCLSFVPPELLGALHRGEVSGPSAYSTAGQDGGAGWAALVGVSSSSLASSHAKGIMVGADMSRHGGQWRRITAAASDRLAGAMLHAGAGKGRGGARARRAGDDLTLLLGSRGARALRSGVAKATARAKSSMSREAAALGALQRRGLRVAGRIVRGTEKAAEKVAGRALAAVQGMTTGTVPGEAVPPQRKRNRVAQAVKRSTGAPAPGQLALGYARADGGGAQVSVALDPGHFAAALAEDTHWWWSASLPRSAIRQPESRLQLFVQHMVLHAMSINVSFVRDMVAPASPSALTATEKEGEGNEGVGGGEDEDGPGVLSDFVSDTLVSPVMATLSSIGIMALSLHRAPLRLRGLELVHVLAEADDLTGRIYQHLLSAALSEVYKVVFSADVLGNPVGVVAALGNGVRDFFVEPAAGLVRSPAEFGRGLAVGSLSLVSNTLLGAGLGVASVASTMGRGVASLAFDEDYARERAERSARSAGGRTTLADGLMEGSRDLGRGLAQGIAGVVLDPLRGAAQGGALGFVKGVGKGLTGLVVKPVAGVLDLAARTTEGVVATARQLSGEAAGAYAAPVRQRHQRLLWGIDRALIAVDATLHGVMIAVIRKALEAALDDAEAERKASMQGQAAQPSTAAVAVGDGCEEASQRGGRQGIGFGAMFRRAKGTGSGSGAGQTRPPTVPRPHAGHPTPSAATAATLNTALGALGLANSYAVTERAALRLAGELRDLVTGKEGALRAALAASPSTYMHHILWPRSPYLLIITTRAWMLARVSRAALSGSSMHTQTIHMCWQSPVVTPGLAAASASASLSLLSVAGQASRRKAGGGGRLGRGLASLGAAVRDLDAAGSLASAASVRTRADAPLGARAGHALFVRLCDAMGAACVDAAAGIEATRQLRGALAASGATSSFAPVVALHRRGELLLSTYGLGDVGGGGGTARPRLAVRTNPVALMQYDAYVQRRMSALAGRAPDDPLFGLPPLLVDSMTIFTEPLPLHWGDAISTLANVRPDEPPAHNVACITSALSFMDRAYVKYCRDRSTFLGENPSAVGAGEREALAQVVGLEREDVVPLFNFCVAKALIDRPVLCSVLATVWLEQQDGQGGHGHDEQPEAGKPWTVEAFALAMFKSATEWAVSVAL